jgi:hypothetical protein
VPESMGSGLTAATDDCVAVGTATNLDGATAVDLTDGPVEPADLLLVFEGRLETPSRSIRVRDVAGAVYLAAPVAGPSTSLRIWVNDTAEPDLVVVTIQPTVGAGDTES